MSCLIHVNKNSISWTAASRHCEHEGGHLWSINSHEQWRELLMLRNVNASENNTVFANLHFELFQTELLLIGLKDDEVMCKMY